MQKTFPTKWIRRKFVFSIYLFCLVWHIPSTHTQVMNECIATKWRTPFWLETIICHKLRTKNVYSNFEPSLGSVYYRIIVVRVSEFDTLNQKERSFSVGNNGSRTMDTISFLYSIACQDLIHKYISSCSHKYDWNICVRSSKYICVCVYVCAISSKKRTTLLCVCAWKFIIAKYK